jgi:pimeloyl-[acyl-carrier protein] methyl ester esterase
MTLQVQVQGSGPALVLLHGWGMNAAVWRALSAALSADFCVHAVEMPGYGIAAEASCDTLAATVAALAAAVPQRATVCGWSLGGQVALAWARALPLQVARLILLATTPRFVAADDWADGMAPAEFAEFAGDVAANPPRARMRFLALQANGDGAAREVLRELRGAFDGGGEAAPPALAAGLQLLRDNDLRADLEVIGQPALVMHGVNDALIPCAAGAYLARTLPDAEFALVNGAGHAVFVTREAMVARRILEFHG